jgi:glutathione S-transferase
MVQYKLTYFNGRGRAEVIRFIFAAAGQPYQDNRVEFANWPALKPSTPFGKLPVLEIINSKTIKISQSMTIARYLAREFKLAGSNSLEAAMADMYADQLVDLFNEMLKSHFEKDEAKKKELSEKFNKETLPNTLSKFEAQLAGNNGHLAGKELTYADVILFSFFQYLK